MVESKSSSAADKITDPGMALPEISASHQDRARKLEKHTALSLSRLIIGAYRIFLLRRLCLALVRRSELTICPNHVHL